MRPPDLIKSARVLVEAGRGKPTQVNLRRAISTAYYAMFHCLARASADLLVGGENAVRSQAAWRQVYRALDHGQAKNACSDTNVLQKFPKEIEDFANTFRAMQLKRHSADYDAYVNFIKSEVIQDILTIENSIKGFESCAVKDKRAFCAFVLFKKRQ